LYELTPSPFPLPYGERIKVRGDGAKRHYTLNATRYTLEKGERIEVRGKRKFLYYIFIIGYSTNY